MYSVTGSKASIFVRKTLQFRPERSSRGGKPPLLKLEEQELRFSMKMMFAPVTENANAACLNCFV